MTPLVQLLGAGALAGGACVAYGTFIERRWYRLRTVSIPRVLRRPSQRPLRILHVSDLHIDPPEASLTAFLEAVALEAYDLVAVTGDILGAEGAEVQAARMLSVLTADGTPGLAVLGSNDRFAPAPKNPFAYLNDPDRRQHGGPLDTGGLIEQLAAAGIRTLPNGRHRVSTALGEVAVAALDDPHLEEPGQPLQLPAAAELTPATDDALLHLGLVHAPYRIALDLLQDADHQLTLSGHTHGGQVRFPPYGAVVGNCDLPLAQVRGASAYGGGQIHISPGLGTSRYAPFRFACRPEATILELS